MRDIFNLVFKLMTAMAIFNAVKKGPRGLAAYGVRRTLRQQANRYIRRLH